VTPFTAEALVHISQASQGVPRLINVICDNALTQAFSEGSGLVESRHVFGACQDLHLALAAPLKTLTVNAPRPLPVTESCPLKTLERYAKKAATPSVLAWLGIKLGIVQRMETA